jgi:hypothetical protein
MGRRPSQHRCLISEIQNGGEGVRTTRQPPYLPNIATADFFLFQIVKSELANLSLSHSSFNLSLYWVVCTITKKKFGCGAVDGRCLSTTASQ